MERCVGFIDKQQNYCHQMIFLSRKVHTSTLFYVFSWSYGPTPAEIPNILA